MEKRTSFNPAGRSACRASRLAAYAAMAVAALIGYISLLAFFVCFLFFGSLNWIPLGLSESGEYVLNTVLCAVFFLQHSVMIRQSYRRWSARIIPPHYHGASYTIASGIALLALVLLWQESDRTLFSAQGAV